MTLRSKRTRVKDGERVRLLRDFCRNISFFFFFFTHEVAGLVIKKFTVFHEIISSIYVRSESLKCCVAMPSCHIYCEENF